MSADHVTVLRALDGALMAKTITRSSDGGFDVKPYGHAFEFSVEEIQVADIVELGRLLADLERDPAACVVRGRPVPSTDLRRCRRLLHDREDDRATFTAAPRRWIALDLDGIETPVWNEDDLARRREAILADYAARNTGAIGLPAHLKPAADLDDEAERAVWEMDIAGDADPTPINPTHDPEIIVRYVISTLPLELDGVHCWWQLTAGAGIKPGIRLRVWFWLDRPVSDDEARRWLADSPVDVALYSPVQPYYVARPIFRPRSLDPVPVRSGMWWRHVAAVPVPELPPEPEPAPPAATITRSTAHNDPLARRADAYADGVLTSLAKTGRGEWHTAMRSAAIRLYGMAEHGLLEHATVTSDLLAVASQLRWPQKRINDLLDWCRAHAAADPQLPEAFQ